MLNAENFEQCRTNCEVILGVDDDATMTRPARSRARAKENCRCLCKALKLRNRCDGKSASDNDHACKKMYTA